ncbi:MAG: glutamyl-tRNA reductase [Proteobacteria bacterium]|nr:glutamyl-tRNA reductase [Pseudomonadota bacterium]MBU1714183.1 glutamyl-tRNA reductase [Pseudomonadota bacterium]
MQVENIIALGVNHKTAPVAIREKLAFSGDCQEPLRIVRGIEGCEECCILSTCNRVEIIFVSNQPEVTSREVRKFLFSKSNLTEEETKKYSYLHYGRDAIIHLFRVASSLDSMIVGEPQILGQLKQAFRDATEEKCTGLVLNRFIQKAFSVAKRIRTETNIGGSAVSISYAAVQLAKKIFGDLSDKKVLLIGAGEMAELAAEHLINQGIKEVVVANRTLERAVKLARRFNGSAVSLEELIPQLETVDILISSTGATDLVLRRDDVKPIMRQRMNRPLFLIDIAVPRDLDPELNDLDNIYLYDIDDLKNVVDINKEARDKEAACGERIVGEETLKFQQWLAGMEISPTISQVRKRADDIIQLELTRTFGQLKELSPKDKKSIEKLATSISNKLLHNPIIFLKSITSGDDVELNIDMFRQIFGLDQDKSDNVLKD